MIRKIIMCCLLLVSLTTAIGVVPAAGETVGYVTSTGLNIRSTPSTGGRVLRCATNGEKLIILREEGDWYYVQYNSVVSGYASKKYITKSSAAASSSSSSTSSTTSAENLPDKISQLGSAPASSRTGDRGENVKKLQQALKILGYYSMACDGVFGQNTEKAVKQFQQARGLSQDGVAGKVTIKVLFGENAADDTGSSAGGSTSSSSSTSSGTGSGKSTEVMDWFKDSVSSMIPKGTHVTIKDVRTGTTFRAKHLFGANHMDAEPLTKDDTATLKRIYGGNWSWDRRPILILCSGRVFAASMNGMPHGDESIYDNNFDGQFCIHFKNSKTHGSSNVDSDHQACVNEAARASW